MFFVSSRRRHTRWPRDWSSDVCSSDLYERENIEGVRQERAAAGVKTRYDFEGKGRVEYETQGSLMAVWNKTKIKGINSTQEGTALELLGQFLRRDVNDKYDPREGNLIEIGRASCRERVYI